MHQFISQICAIKNYTIKKKILRNTAKEKVFILSVDFLLNSKGFKNFLRHRGNKKNHLPYLI